MKLFLVVIAVATGLTPQQLYANLGETEQQSEARYGKSIDEPMPLFADENAKMYEKSGILIRVTFRDGKTEAIQYQKKPTADGKVVSLSGGEIVQLLKENTRAGKWKKVDVGQSNIAFVNGPLFAQYTVASNVLLIAKQTYLKRVKRQKDADEAAARHQQRSDEGAQLTGKSTGEDWLNASREERMLFCKATAQELRKPGVNASFIFGALAAFYADIEGKEHQRELQQMTLSEVVAACVMMGEALAPAAR